jgi:hypothetical protein
MDKIKRIYKIMVLTGTICSYTFNDGARPPLFLNFCVVLRIVCFLSLCVLFVCKCVLNYNHRVATQLQLTNISYHTILAAAAALGHGVGGQTPPECATLGKPPTPKNFVNYT